MRYVIDCVSGGNKFFDSVTSKDLEKFEEIKRCPACESENRDTVAFLGNNDRDLSLEVLICRKCGHVHYSRLPGSDWHESFYKNKWDFAGRQKAREKIKPEPYPGSYWSYFFALNIPKEAKILDFGCGFGKRLSELDAMGYQNLWGVEPGLHRFETANAAFPGRIRNGSAREVLELSRDGKFDLIFSTHVVEHIPDPIGIIRELAKALKPGGLVLIVVPRVYGEAPTDSLLYLSHPHLFNEVSLASAFRKGGLRPYSWDPSKFDFELAVVGSPDLDWRPGQLEHLFREPSAEAGGEMIGKLTDYLRAPFCSLGEGGKKLVAFFCPPAIGHYPSGFKAFDCGLGGRLHVFSKTNSLMKKMRKIPVLGLLPKVLGLIGKTLERKNRGYLDGSLFEIRPEGTGGIPEIVTKSGDVPILIK